MNNSALETSHRGERARSDETPFASSCLVSGRNSPIKQISVLISNLHIRSVRPFCGRSDGTARREQVESAHVAHSVHRWALHRMCRRCVVDSAGSRRPCCPAKARAHRCAFRALLLAGSRATVRSTRVRAPMSVAALQKSGCACTEGPAQRRFTGDRRKRAMAW